MGSLASNAKKKVAEAASQAAAHGAAALEGVKQRDSSVVPGWHFETLYPDFGQALKIDRTLYDETPGDQRIQVIENARFGRVLILDGAVQTTAADEFIYHEMLCHTPIFAHGAAKRVLIIGGGDGGMAREVLRHKSVEKLVMVEIDKGVVEFSKQYLPSLSEGAFDDPRLELKIADGVKYMAKDRPKFDVIILDRPDPIGPALGLFTDAFYAACKNRLRSGGVLVAQNGVPFQQPDELRESVAGMRKVFADVSCYLATVPTYAGGPMAFTWASDSANRRKASLKMLEKRFADSGIKTRYYNPAVHLGAFALPGCVQELVG